MSLMRRAAFSPREAVEVCDALRGFTRSAKCGANSLQKQLQSAVGFFFISLRFLDELTFCNIKLPVCCLNPSDHQYK